MTASSPSLADSLIQALHQPGQERLLDLVRNPLRLSMLCETWNGTLPDTQAQLYEDYIQKVYTWNHNLNILNNHAIRCGTDTTALIQQLNKKLGELSQAALDLPQERFRLSQKLIKKCLGAEIDNKSLCHLALRLGLLNRVGVDAQGKTIFAFYHATFQEYFAALAVEDWDYFVSRNHVNFPVAGKEYRIFEPQWKQVILFWLGREDVGDEEKERFIEKLVEFDGGCRDFYKYQAYFLAAEGISQYSDFESVMSIADLKLSLVDTIVQQLISWGLGHFDPNRQDWITYLEPVQAGARNALKLTKRDKVIFHLTQQLEVMIQAGCVETFIGEDFEAEREELLSYFQEDPGCGNLDFTLIISYVQWLQSYPRSRESLLRIFADFLEEINPKNPVAIAAFIEVLETTDDENARWQAANSLGKIDLGDPEAITIIIEILIEILETTDDEDTRRGVAYSLGKIGQGNPVAIDALVELIRTTEDEDTRRLAAESLGEIGKDNPVAINALVELIRTTEDEETRWQAASSLGKIDKDNPVAINALVELIRTTEDEDTRWRAASSLGEIGKDNPVAINALVELIRTTQNEHTRKWAASSLGKIDKDNPVAIDALVELIRTTQNKHTRWLAASSLGAIGKDNPVAINALVELIRTTQDELTRGLAAESLGEIDKDNPVAINALVELIRTTQDKHTRWWAAESLGKIDKDNPVAINPLVELIRTTEDKHARRQAAESLGKIGKDNPVVIDALVELIGTTQDEDTRRYAASSLGEIGKDNPVAIDALVELIRTTQNEHTRKWAASSLGKILTEPQQMLGVVSALKDCLSDEVYQNDFAQFHKCYEVIWNCAENLTYPQFYQAWHGLTGTQTSPFVQTLNLAQLPQLLQTQLTETNLHQTLQLFCIDGSKFVDPDNPAADIYLQLVKKHHCPQSTEGTPDTLTKLKIYWELLDWEKHPILIFYEQTNPQSFSQTFLDFLTRLDATICVITDSPHPTLPTFSPQDPHLIQTIMNGLQRTVLEA